MLHIDERERLWIIISSITLSAFFAALLIGAVVFGVRLPEPAGFVNPSFLDNTPFAEPGIVQVGENDYEVYMTARMWAFNPSRITVPVDSRVTFHITSEDITHGYMIEHHNVNLQLVPGHIAQTSVTFDALGEFAMLCHEYCGRGHHLMWGTITVVDPEAEPENETAMTTQE